MGPALPLRRCFHVAVPFFTNITRMTQVAFGVSIPLFVWDQQLIWATRKQLLQNRVLSKHYLFTQMIHSNQIKMRKRLHHSLPVLYLSLQILGKLHWEQLPHSLMCGRKDSFYSALFSSLLQTLILCLDQMKRTLTEWVETNRHAHHYWLYHWPLPDCWYFHINLMCHHFVFFLKNKSLPALTYRTAKTT